MRELVIKVPSPFSGVDDVGFSARYPAQELSETLHDIPVIVEGSSRPMQLLVNRLSLFPDKNTIVGGTAADEAYTWSYPIQLSDEICVLSFRDISLKTDDHDPAHLEQQYIWNLIRPHALTFLRDCVRIGKLKLREEIDIVVNTDDSSPIDLSITRSAIVEHNGTQLLYVA